MFGYVIPRKDLLTQEQRARYRAGYCGLCRALKKRYGFRARFLVNYDMTFLYFLLRGGEGKSAYRCFCPANPFCRKNCLPVDGAMEFAADLTVLLSWHKLADARRDGGFFTTLGAKLGQFLYRRPYRRAAKARPAEDQTFAAQLECLSRLEQENCTSIDRVADSFASMLRICAMGEKDALRRRPLELLLYHTGRYLYLTDALEDLPKDLKKNTYNPLRYRYSLLEGKLSPEDRRQFLDTVEASISMAASAWELLEHGADASIVDNIIYYGMPAVLHSVDRGTFRKRGKIHERSL